MRTRHPLTMLLPALGILMLAVVGTTLAKPAANDSVTTASESGKANSAEQTKLVVYYFHGNVRCVNCVNFEKFTDELMRTVYADAIKQGKIAWKIVNFDEPQNEHFINDSQLFTKSLVLVLMKNGKQQTYKSLVGIWQVAGNKEKFQSYIRSEIDAMLQKAK